MDTELDTLPVDPDYNENAKKIVLGHFEELYSLGCKRRRICHVLKAVYDAVEDEHTKDLVMQATWFALKMNRKLDEFNNRQRSA